MSDNTLTKDEVALLAYVGTEPARVLCVQNTWEACYVPVGDDALYEQ